MWSSFAVAGENLLSRGVGHEYTTWDDGHSFSRTNTEKRVNVDAGGVVSLRSDCVGTTSGWAMVPRHRQCLPTRHSVSFDCVDTLGLTSTPGQGLGALIKNSNIPVVKVDSVTLLARDLPDDIEGL